MPDTPSAAKTGTVRIPAKIVKNVTWRFIPYLPLLSFLEMYRSELA
jgi:hypothetical protein